ncbi:hypothetical protein EVA_06972, partial [gut metagenome]
MKMKLRHIIYLCIASLPLLGGCGKWLDVKPYDKISDSELLSSEDGFKKLLNGIYIELNRDMLYGSTLTVEMVEVMGGAYTIGSDNAVWGNYSDLAKYSYNTTFWRARLSETWDKAYAMILNCNLLLEGADRNEGLFSPENY